MKCGCGYGFVQIRPFNINFKRNSIDTVLMCKKPEKLRDERILSRMYLPEDQTKNTRKDFLNWVGVQREALKSVEGLMDWFVYDV